MFCCWFRLWFVFIEFCFGLATAAVKLFSQNTTTLTKLVGNVGKQDGKAKTELRDRIHVLINDNKRIAKVRLCFRPTFCLFPVLSKIMQCCSKKEERVVMTREKIPRKFCCVFFFFFHMYAFVRTQMPC